jgi:phosphate starvation-inducible protein PhoH and related proteins
MSKTQRRSSTAVLVAENDNRVIDVILPKKHRLKCKNIKQKEFANLINEKEIVIAAGPAGVGKSYIAIARGIELIQNKTTPYDTLIITKPAIEAGEKLGHLPGDMKEKMEPHVASSLDIIDKIIGKSNRQKLEELEIIKVEPLGFIRGKTIDSSVVVIEEVQNMSPEQVKTILTRIGENSKYILSGDLDQSDKYRNVTQSGLYDVMNRHKNISEIGFFEFKIEDIVRNPIICKILKNYDTIDNMAPKKNNKQINVIKNKTKVKNTKPKFFRRLNIFLKRKFK